MIYTRRAVARLALAALPVSKLVANPNSRFGEVQIGIIISPYNYPEIPVRADLVLHNLIDLGISAFEMQDVRAEVYAGAPGDVRQGYSGSPSAADVTPEAQRKTAEELKQWRLSAPLDKYRALRQLYTDAGVTIYAFRLAKVSETFEDAEYDYFFEAAEALGANQITVELPQNSDLTKRIANFASQYKIMMVTTTIRRSTSIAGMRLLRNLLGTASTSMLATMRRLSVNRPCRLSKRIMTVLPACI
jgi:hypothetical protein